MRRASGPCVSAGSQQESCCGQDSSARSSRRRGRSGKLSGWCAGEGGGEMKGSHSEEAFEEAVEASLLGSGWLKAAAGFFRPDLGLDTGELFAFIGTTQNAAWAEVIKRHGNVAGVAQDKFLARLASEIFKRGTVDVLRHGVVDQGVTIRLAYFRPAHGLTPELVEGYKANRLTVARQLRYEAGSDRAVDLALFVNGIPVATVELKNQLTGQDVDNAITQYRYDRDPRNVTLA